MVCVIIGGNMRELLLIEDGVQMPITRKSNFYSRDELLFFLKSNELFLKDGSKPTVKDIDLFLGAN